VVAVSTTTVEPSTNPASRIPTTRITNAGGVFVQTTSAAAAQTQVTLQGGSSGIPAESLAAANSGYVFNAQSSQNVAVYFGQTPVTDTTTLADQCADPNIDIVILAFVISTTDGGLYPQINFGSACRGQTPLMAQAAPGLLSCPELAANIQTCQKTWGKKVLLSIGGATSQISLSTKAQASGFADVLWDLFGPPGNIDIALRPFATAEIDGFDVGLSPEYPIPLPQY